MKQSYTNEAFVPYIIYLNEDDQIMDCETNGEQKELFCYLYVEAGVTPKPIIQLIS